MVAGQIAEKAAFVFKPVGMMMEGPHEKKEDKEKR
jgi:hypothetical protein